MGSHYKTWPTSKPRPGDLQRHSQRLSRLPYAISMSFFREASLNGLTDQSPSEPSCGGLKSRPAIIHLSMVVYFVGLYRCH